MQIWKSLRFVSFFIAVLLLASCESDYTRLVKRELSKEVREDSLLLGIKFGHTREEFYGRCFDLNKKRIVVQGVGFSVMYIIKDSLSAERSPDINMMFYPRFDSANIIKGMDIELFYPGWAAGSHELGSDTLRNRLVKIFRTWYKGNDFMNVTIDKEDVLVKVDVNRRIIIKLEDEKRVLVHIQDLVHPDYRHDGVSINESLERHKKIN